MFMKKLISAMMALTLVLTCFAGCGKKERDTSTLAMYTENYSVTKSMLTYCFNSQYLSFVTANRENLEAYGLDTTQPLDKQECPLNNANWYDYFMDVAKSRLEQCLIVAEKATADGKKLSEAEEKAIEAELEVLKSEAKKKKLIVILSIVLAVLLVGGAASYIFYFEPNARYTEAVDLYNDGKYEEASTLFAELGNFKDSADRVTQCDTAIKQEKYDAAMKKAENNKYAEAISMLTELGDFADSKAKITELENKYYGLLQQIYAYVARGFETDTLLANCVYNVLWTSDLYDAYDSVAMSHLYGGTSYRTYYYFSRYSNGYAYVVEYDTADAFVSLLDLTNDNAVDIDLLLLGVENPPQKYKALYDKVKSMCSTYSKFHNYVSKEPSVSYSSYESTSKSHQSSVKNAMDAAKKADSKIADKVSAYEWN